MADYGCWPLWEDGPAIGNVDPETLPISDRLKERLASWAAEYDASLNQDDPAGSRVDDSEVFEATGRDLAKQLSIELGETIIVRYWRDDC
ncbi:MAG: hypothetical protein QOI95_1700 [Acidimicrobiaceae bacterium]|jgi:hypothetical protein